MRPIKKNCYNEEEKHTDSTFSATLGTVRAHYLPPRNHVQLLPLHPY